MVKPIKPFRAVVPGSAYHKEFTPDDDLEVNSVAAKAALDLGCLSEDDAKSVQDALDAAAKAEAKKKDDAAKAEAKANGAAPENKSGGAKG